jgi:predicted metallopeptidase
MRYEFAPDLQEIAIEISLLLFPHINVNRIKCFRSYGTSSKRTIARCHSLNKLMQKALSEEPFYPLEFLSEQFDRLNQEDQIKVIIHELLHIPKTFGGGFVQHHIVNRKNVEKNYREYKKSKNEKKSWFQI